MKYRIQFWERVNYEKEIDLAPGEKLQDAIDEIIQDGEFDPMKDCTDVAERDYGDIFDENGDFVDVEEHDAALEDEDEEEEDDA